MTAKRFKSINCGLQGQYIKDDGVVLTIDEVVELLNELHEENTTFREALKELKEIGDYQAMRINELNDENEQLKTKNNAYIQDIEVFKEENTHLKLENEELKQRNDRQAKQLDRLYQLIEEKDWRTLTDIMDDFKRCEEQLQREWRTYE